MSIIIALTAGAFAQDADFAGTAALAEDEALVAEEAKTTLSAQLGGQLTTGNAQLYVVNAGLNLGRRWDRNKLGFVAGAITGGSIPDSDASGSISEAERDEGYLENARRVFGEARYDRFLSERDAVYGIVGAFHDVYAGFDLRSHQQVGYSRLLVGNDRTSLRGEAGIDYAQEWRTTDEFANILAARLGAALAHQFNDNVSFTDSFEVYENVIDTADLRLLNSAAITASLSTNLSVQLNHALIFDNVPVEGFRKLDQTIGVNLVATLL